MSAHQFFQEFCGYFPEDTLGPAHNLWCWYREATESFDEALPSARPRGRDASAWPTHPRDQQAMQQNARRLLMDIKQAAAKLGISEEAFDAASHDTARWDRSEWRRLRFANPAVVAALQSVRARDQRRSQVANDLCRSSDI